MTCRDEILKRARNLRRIKGNNRFSIAEIVHCMKCKGTRYQTSTIRTHVTSRMCANAPKHHAVTYDDFLSLGSGEYRFK